MVTRTASVRTRNGIVRLCWTHVQARVERGEWVRQDRRSTAGHGDCVDCTPSVFRTLNRFFRRSGGQRAHQ